MYSIHNYRLIDLFFFFFFSCTINILEINWFCVTSQYAYTTRNERSWNISCYEMIYNFVYAMIQINDVHGAITFAAILQIQNDLILTQ